MQDFCSQNNEASLKEIEDRGHSLSVFVDVQSEQGYRAAEERFQLTGGQFI